MEPSVPNPQTAPEQGPVPARPEQVTPAADQPPAAPATPPAAPAQPPVIPAGLAPAQPPVAPAAPATSGAAPATADDVDVIEKEWVDAAQAVVAKNAHDPYNEEEGFEDLQVDYLKKRYGKDIKKPDKK